MGFKTNKCCCAEAVPPYATLFVLNKYTGALEYKFPYVSIGNPIGVRMGIDLYAESDKAYEIGTAITTPANPNGTFHAFKWDIAAKTRDWREETAAGSGTGSASLRSFMTDTYFAAANVNTGADISLFRRDNGDRYLHTMLGELMHAEQSRITALERDTSGSIQLGQTGATLRLYEEDSSLVAEQILKDAYSSTTSFPGLTGNNVADRDNQYFAFETYDPPGAATIRHRVRWFDGYNNLNEDWSTDNISGGGSTTTFFSSSNKVLTDGMCGYVATADNAVGGRLRVRKYCGGYEVYNVVISPWPSFQKIPFVAVNENLYGYFGQRIWRVNGQNGTLGWVSSHTILNNSSLVLSALNHQLAWKVTLDEGILYFGLGYAGVVAIDEVTGYVLWQTINKGFTKPIIDGDGLWTVGLYDNT